MFRKLVAIILAVLINFAVLAWFHNWSTTIVADATPPQRTGKVLSLPTINVYPTRAQLDMLRRESKPIKADNATAYGGTGMQTLVMPYYSFADSPDAADKG